MVARPINSDQELYEHVQQFFLEIRHNVEQTQGYRLLTTGEDHDGLALRSETDIQVALRSWLKPHCEKFNIDHVVIAPQGVFAVETKGYAKPNRDGGTADATVVFDGKALVFPQWSGSKPLEQADRQAKWLATWLTSATGERVHVAPVVALPGWYVDRKGRGDVLVFSGRELRKHLLRARTAQPIAAEQVQRIVHQVEQRCRNVEPGFRPQTDSGG